MSIPAGPSPSEGPVVPEAQALTTAPSSQTQQTPIAGHRSPIHNPFPASLASECKKAGQIIDSFVNPKYAGLEGAIPRRILAPAKGLVICSVFKAGFLGSVRFGSGLIVCRLPDGSWSAPSAVSLGGLGAGGQFGMEFTNFVFVLNTDAAVTTFLNSGTLTLGGNISIAFGTGRSAETAAMIGTKGIAGIFAYSKTRGVYGGLTFEGGVIVERSSANKKLYGRKLKAKELLTGEMPPPPQAEPLMRILNSECFRLPSASQPSQAEGLPLPVSEASAVEDEVPTTQPGEQIPSEVPAEPEAHSPRASANDHNVQIGDNVQTPSQAALEEPAEASVVTKEQVQPRADEHSSEHTEDQPNGASLSAAEVGSISINSQPRTGPEPAPADQIEEKPTEEGPSK